MKRIATILALMGLMLAVGAGAAFALNLKGDNGPDRLIGGPQDDVLRGLGGRDFLNGKGDSDRMFGGRGADTIVARDGERDLVNCGRGRDTVRADADNEDRIANNCEVVRRAPGGGEGPDDNGNDGPEIGDDNGNDGLELGDDNGDDGPELGDDNCDDD
jgi:Ca2+-binding RTX toxin-like protein